MIAAAEFPAREGLALPIYRRAIEIAEAEFEAPSAAWARRSIRAADPNWTRAAIIGRYFWHGAVGQAEDEAKVAASDLPREIIQELLDAEAAHYRAQMTDDPRRWETENAATADRLARARKAAADWRAAQSLKAAE